MRPAPEKRASGACEAPETEGNISSAALPTDLDRDMERVPAVATESGGGDGFDGPPPKDTTRQLPEGEFPFGQEYQNLLLACIVRHPEEFRPLLHLLKPNYFSGVLGTLAARFLLDYFKKYQQVPVFVIIDEELANAAEAISSNKEEVSVFMRDLEDLDSRNFISVRDAVVNFVRNREVKLALRKILEDIKEGRLRQSDIGSYFRDADRIGHGDTIVARPLMDLVVSEEESKAANLLGSHFLTLGPRAALMVNGPTGIGKSTLMLQAVICWAINKDFFGIKPSRPLKFLFVAAENDARDFCEMRDGIVESLDLTLEQRRTVNENVRMVTLQDRGAAVFTTLDRLVGADFKPDVVVLDPLLGFFDGDINRQVDASRFLREQLQPFLVRHKVAAILVHHTGKPPSKSRDRNSWANIDATYAGTGSSEIANWAQASLFLRPQGSDGAFELVLGKRGQRAGLVDDLGNSAKKIVIRHSPLGIFWERGNDGEAQAQSKASPDKIVSVFKSFNKTVTAGGEIKAEILAKKVGCSKRTLKRWFGDLDRLSCQGETLIWGTGAVIRMREELDEQ